MAHGKPTSRRASEATYSVLAAVRKSGCPTLHLLTLRPLSTTVTDPEYDIVDELYFVTSFNDLAQRTNLSAAVLEYHLRELLEQEYVKCFYPDPDTEQAYEITSFGAIARDCYYLVTKAGLLEHNTR